MLGNNYQTIKPSKALEKLNVHDHLCLIYETKEEQFDSVIPFIKIGLERGEQCIYVADENSVNEVLEEMSNRGIAVDAVLKSQKLMVATKKESYLREKPFDPDRMIDFLTKTTTRAKKEGYSALRVTGEMTWALGDEKDIERLIEYEAKLNLFFPHHDCIAICQYNHNRFSPDVILNVIRTHPTVIFKGIVCKNLYYVPPDEFLKPDQVSREVERLLQNILDREKAENQVFRINRAFMTLGECNKVLVHSEDETELLNNICKAIVEIGGHSFAWVGYAGKDKNKTVHPIAHFGNGKDYFSDVRVTWMDTKRGNTPMGSAISSGRASISKDILNDPAYSPYLNNIKNLGFVSSVAFPLIIDDKTIGALNIYSKELDAFDEKEFILLSELSKDLSYGIKSLRTRKKHLQAERRIRKSLTENQILLSELHHRVKNNLQVIISMLGLQADQVQNRQLSQILEECQRRIHSIALVHESLYKSKDFSKIYIQSYIQTMVMELQNTFRIYDRISCELEIQNIVLSIENAVPCGLIINELVSNALMHAFPNSRQGKVIISLTETDKNHFELIVQDNGIGITNDLKTLEKKSLGIRIVGLLTKQIDGSFKMESKKGTKFTIRFKVENE